MFAPQDCFIRSGQLFVRVLSMETFCIKYNVSENNRNSFRGSFIILSVQDIEAKFDKIIKIEKVIVTDEP